jgi:uncharacterized protein YjbJ (UPF0337 family)
MTLTKPSTQDKTAGKIHEVKGAVKQKIGEITNNPNLRVSGEAEKNLGKAQGLVGKLEKTLGN